MESKYFKNYENERTCFAKVATHIETGEILAVYHYKDDPNKEFVISLDKFTGYVRDSCGHFVRRFMPCDYFGGTLAL